MDVNALPGHRDPGATEKRMANEQLIKALDATREVQITVTGRKTGRPITLPVWFVREGDRVYLVPLKGADTDWYKNVLKEPAIRVAAGGRADHRAGDSGHRPGQSRGDRRYVPGQIRRPGRGRVLPQARRRGGGSLT